MTRDLIFFWSVSETTTHLGEDLLLRREHHSRIRSNPDRGAGVTDRLHGVLHLIQAPLGAERRRVRIVSSRHREYFLKNSNQRGALCSSLFFAFLPWVSTRTDARPAFVVPSQRAAGSKRRRACSSECHDVQNI